MYLNGWPLTFKLFTKNKLKSRNQSSCRPGNSCIDQLLSVNHEILKAFEIGIAVRRMFLNISKMFDKV